MNKLVLWTTIFASIATIIGVFIGGYKAIPKKYLMVKLEPYSFVYSHVPDYPSKFEKIIPTDGFFQR